MQNKIDENYEDVSPNPEYLIKSIAEQGYSLETALADLMDNSISANATKIEALIKMDKEPFTLYLTDNGNGMNEEVLKSSMRFPSNSPESERGIIDLGRFGLGMKTASFSQTRCFTVISKQKGTLEYSGRTWDVAHLKKEKRWELKINSQAEIGILLKDYSELSDGHLNRFENFEANTIVIWQGLYKFENYLEDDNRQKALKKEITEVTSDYLSLVFHRFMERKEYPLEIRINNNLIIPFNPFPTEQKDFRPMEYKQRHFSTDTIKMEGFILPSRSVEESKQRHSIWTTKNRGLMDMEGIYIYRADRIILFGGWNGLIKKGPRLQLARLRVDVGNSVDHLLHLNVAKSQIVIPHDLKNAFENYIEELKIEAEREYFNRGIRKFAGNKKGNVAQLFERVASNKGILLKLNAEFALTKSFKATLNDEQATLFRLISKMVNTQINEIRQAHQDTAYSGVSEKDEIEPMDLEKCIIELKKNGLSVESIREDILPGLGFNLSSLPEAIINLLNRP
ncbi:ATP-binding protein [Pedobacter frigiditerrae]|uniref:ATP-binding protein n=1 Tax=Pedobacter frigiditerrae TaxID=2530452 RepID=A0A4R0MPK8_9SPHI|nr:ATP-binding protein [Pedobacter frigiditerrae]TCC88781.1 ATP-binding protein [Pedobacter frigiditerrae]